MICRINKNIKKECSPYVLSDVREIYLLNYSDFDGYDVDNCEYCLDWDESSKFYRIDVENASFSDSLAIGNNQNKYRNVSLTFSLYNSKDACVEEAYNAIVLGKYVAVFFTNGVWYVSGLLNGMTVNESESNSESHTITLEENTTLTSQILNAECAQDVVDSANGEEPTPVISMITAYFDVDSTQFSTKIMGQDGYEYISDLLVDGEPQTYVTEYFDFDTTGIHEVEYLLSNPTTIGAEAFREAEMIEIDIPEGVQYIGQNAFYRCANLETVSLPNTLRAISEGAFEDCSSIEELYIPTSVSVIEDYSFDGCSGITNINVSSSNRVYDSRNNCDAIIETATNRLIVGCDNTIIPNTVTKIGNDAFYRRGNLESITIPSSVNEIESAAFWQCDGLESITVEATTPPTLGTRVFEYTNNCPIYVPCESVSAYQTAWSEYSSRITCVQPPLVYDLVGTFNVTSTSEPTQILNNNSVRRYNSIEIDGVAQPSVVTSYTFSTTGNHTVKYVLNDNTTIANYSFSGCTGLTSITIPNSITTIGRDVFRNTGLNSITIPNNVTTISQYAFANCSSLTDITIPNGVTVINENTFSDCTNLSKVNSNVSGECIIPNSVTSIGNLAFQNCTNITSVTLPNTLTTIGKQVFQYTGLTTVTIPDSVTTIGNHAFNGCGYLTSVIIGSGVTTIGSTVFESCGNMTSITVEATIPPTIGIDVFDTEYNYPIYVPAESVEAYKTATNWSDYASRIQAIPNP